MSGSPKAPVRFSLVGAATPSVSVDEVPVSRRLVAAEQRPLLATAYPTKKRVYWMLFALTVGVLVAGFWNFRAVDGFGREVVAANTVGSTSEAATSFGENGLGFGVLFAIAAGLAATFTACNCVVFAMIPGIACNTDKAASRRMVTRSLLWMLAGMLLVSASYGAFVGLLGADGATAFNSRGIRLSMARTVFSLLGIALIVWAMIEMGFLTRYTSKLSPTTRAFFGQSTVKAGVAGVMVGLFSVGRPFGPFHDFITYAASFGNPFAGAFLMSLQGLAMVAVMVVLLLALVKFGGARIADWVSNKPAQPALVTAVALAVGGAYFLYYWGFAFAWDIGRWGFKLGIWT